MSGKRRNQFSLSVNQVKGINKNRSGMGKEIKRSFVFNIDWRDVLMDYPAEVRYEVYDAIIEYAASGKLLDLKPLAKMAFSFIKKEMDYNNERYIEKVEKNRENGKKGGAPKGNRNAKKTKSKTTETTQNNRMVEKTTETTLNDNDNDIKEISLSRDKEIPQLEKDIKMPLDECHAYILKNYSQWTETVTMNIRSSGFPDFTMDSFKDYLRRFFEKLKNEGEDGKSPSDAQSHFYRWLVIQLGNATKNAYLAENNRLLEWLPDGMYKRFVGMVHDFAPYCFANMKMPSEEEVDGFKHMFESTKTIREALMQVENNTELRRKREYLGQTIRDQLAITKKINT